MHFECTQAWDKTDPTSIRICGPQTLRYTDDSLRCHFFPDTSFTALGVDPSRFLVLSSECSRFTSPKTEEPPIPIMLYTKSHSNRIPINRARTSCKKIHFERRYAMPKIPESLISPKETLDNRRPLQNLIHPAPSLIFHPTFTPLAQIKQPRAST